VYEEPAVPDIIYSGVILLVDLTLLDDLILSRDCLNESMEVFKSSNIFCLF
jgi:hypothetical protein